MITNLSSTQSDFQHKLSKLLAWNDVSNKEVINTVDNIIANIKAKGDAALIDYSIKFDGVNASSMADLTLDADMLKTAFDNLGDKEKTALQVAANRVRTYHEKQKQTTWTYREDNGTMLGQKITPIERVGLYVPGGKAAYPSSVLMNAIPAKVAGVEELIMVVPTPNGVIVPLVLAAAHLSGVDSVYTVGGAQAIAALAHGTETVPKVDKIVGPGNIYVATAKRAVFGQVGIDMIAGPSEILIICDGKTDPDWIAMDLFSQAEHDEDAQSILLCPDADFIAQVEASIAKLLPTMTRKTIIAKALKERGALIHTKDITEAIKISNQIAPEHLEFCVEDPESMLDDIKHAGAIFMGRNTCEAIGDYCAGPNHVLPTSGTARFSSPLGVYDFQKKSSLIMMSDKGANTLGEIAATLADGEGLQAHARSARYRIQKS
ncbi:histidinol dehydrogenase [bacterium endosymbiont of Bathymodiolus sp. 5 South]|jgi:histidinol dehydrogenase|uniref:histidinol dehydrogenase n=1 Tax=bacterium endosymbiont of Bathymodiolus sp. 5 South TaxID=1181670 RepID=UPI0010B17CB4|nr:histidinol dehydrogenase [bacterium endosymbiont of Bathymodiolus sp. 5 South]CAC9647710.1 Histidinol dehydrogenase (EC 1.1.1.23) [uncultured Gammaproteobacteria bacterium]CAC9658177.1 Histidinol dehydrogenase (EC 1.1.1.23) [uncultured Gammaproteobacteria bacterium]SHN89565.1 Histidinol dehydrogenase [bacterium endosymbiont of Bathymodiolus sp. 5 South]SSC09008.1 Histidinol dehydrogenase [bacterium endosymbiont of Bathymodiolus sp. 5 South]VVH58551.1 Histidinol dehydrogenase (EC [uncultured